MRYKLDINGYVIAVSFGCYLDSCTEYTGTVPIGYNSLDDWATYSCINAYYIDHNGNLALDQEKLAECRRKEAQEKVDNAPLVRKDLYESEEVLESQYIKATVTGQAINLTDAKVLPPRIKLTNVDPSAYSDLILYVSNETDTREYTILLNDLETVDYILIDKGLVVASVNGTEEIIGEGHVRLFEGVCNLYTSEAVTIELEYSTNVQDVDNLEFLQGKSTTSKKFKILEDGTIQAIGGNIGNWKIGEKGIYNDDVKMGMICDFETFGTGFFYAGQTYEEMVGTAESGSDIYPQVLITSQGNAYFKYLNIIDYSGDGEAGGYIEGDLHVGGKLTIGGNTITRKTYSVTLNKNAYVSPFSYYGSLIIPEADIKAYGTPIAATGSSSANAPMPAKISDGNTVYMSSGTADNNIQVVFLNI